MAEFNPIYASMGLAQETVKGMHGVNVHTRTPNQHTSMGSGGAIVPVATVDGEPRGFETMKRRKLVIDPNEADSFVVDLGKVSKEMVTEAMAFGSGLDAYRKLAEMTKPELISTVSVPTTALKQAQLTSYPSVTASALTPQPIRLIQQAVPFPTQAQPMAQPDVGNELKQLNQLMQMMVQHLSPKQEPEQLLPKTPREELKVEALVSDLGLPFLQSAPELPSVEVVFDLGQLGSSRARYHHVEVTDHTIVLVYDSRCKNAYEFAPPNTGMGEGAEPLRIMLPGRYNNSKMAAYHVDALDVRLGVMNITLLIREQDAE